MARPKVFLLKMHFFIQTEKNDSFKESLGNKQLFVLRGKEKLNYC